jgi:hypothetical protein
MGRHVTAVPYARCMAVAGTKAHKLAYTSTESTVPIPKGTMETHMPMATQAANETSKHMAKFRR